MSIGHGPQPQNRLQQAIHYLASTETYPHAYKEFWEVLSKATDGYPRVQGFENKVYCKRIAIFARYMTDTYDAKLETFVPLWSLSKAKKIAIASTIHTDIKALLQEFKTLKIPFSKKLLKKKDLEQKKYQDLLGM